MTELSAAAPAPPADLDFARHVRAIRSHWSGLADKPHETPENTLRALWFAAAGDPRSAARAERDALPALSDAGRERLSALVVRRLAGEPLAHITGRESFLDLELICGPEALVPRRETELLGRAALERLRRTVTERGRAAQVVDLCTGCGNLAVALAHHEPRCEVLGADLSPEAVALAARNAGFCGVADRARFAVGDLFAPVAQAGLAGRVDLVVCNPPYISTPKLAKLPDEIARFEPRLAFDGGAFGISVLFRLVQEAPRYLRPGAWLCFETGAGQGDPMAKRLEREGYAEIQRVHDAAGETRALLARTAGAA